MVRFLFQSVISVVVTVFLVSILLFLMLDPSDGEILVKILGIESTPAQRESLARQLGLEIPVLQRYADWMIGNDFRARRLIGQDITQLNNPGSGDLEWWVDQGEGRYVQYQLGEGGNLAALIRNEDGTYTAEPAGDIWWEEDGKEVFWGIDDEGRAAKWIKGEGAVAYVSTQTGWQEIPGAPVQYIPLVKGVLRGDGGVSLRTNRPISNTISTRAANTFILAGAAFVFVMPLALLFGIIAGINEGKLIDRTISIFGLIGTSTPEFVTGLILIFIFAIQLRWLPALAVDTSGGGLSVRLLTLPVLTLTAVELGYVIRMTRASMVDVMKAPYIRTAIIKGMPFRRVVFRHAVRNALMAPITIIMLHINYFIGGIVVVEILFGYPGLGDFIYKSAIFGDVYGLGAAAIVTVLVAISTRLIGDLIYTFINPRIRYS